MTTRANLTSEVLDDPNVVEDIAVYCERAAQICDRMSMPKRAAAFRALARDIRCAERMRVALEEAAGWFSAYAREHHEKVQKFERLGLHSDASAARAKGGTNAARAHACRVALPTIQETKGEG